jgi:nitrate/TMAO reductase-like tetraheme cytochrome c subunit
MTENTPATSPQPGKLRRWAKRLGITLVAILVAGVALLGVAEHQTAKPDFCGSCHIMEPYHESWQADLHGSKLDVACVDCHYAPGERTTVKAKLRGLSQVASYVSGRYGATRPRAHVSNDSCMTAKCHGDESFMEKEIAVGTVRFKHANHLKLDPQVLETVNKDLAVLSATIRQSVGEERFVELEAAAREAGPHKDRIDRMVSLADASGANIDRSELERLSELNHRGVRIAQLAEIQCTNCHSYGASLTMEGHPAQAHHFSVAATTKASTRVRITA